MKRSWLALTMIALLAGVVVVHRAGRPGKPPVMTPLTARETREDHPAPHPAPARVPEPPREPDAPLPGTRPASDALALPPPAHDIAQPGTLAAVAGAHDEPAPRLAPALPSNAPSSASSGPVPEPVVPPTAVAPIETAPPIAPPPTTGAQRGERAAADGSAAPAEDAESDRAAPVLQSLRFDPPEIKDGGVAILSVSATDDLSGVKIVTGTIQSPSAAFVTFTARDDAASGVFTAAIAIPQHAEMGDWFVAAIQIIDKAENAVNLTFAKETVPPGGSLHVVSADSDSSAPTVRSVSLDKAQVDPGAKNRIVVEVEDDRSGVASVTGAFQNRSKSAFIPFSCRPGGEASSWEADVPVPANADCGEWTLRHLIVTDNAKNTAVLTADDPQVGNTGFLVLGGGACDSEPPIIDGMSFAPAVISNAAAAEVLLTVMVHDDGSGVASLFGRIEGPAAADGQVARIPFECALDPKNPNGPMTARVTVPQHAARGVWSVIWVQVTDKARNTHPYYKDDPALAGGSFTVE